VLAADCLPVLLADPAARVVGAVHAGRQGLAAGVLQAALRVMQELGATPGHQRRARAPAACGRCYEVPAALAEQVEAAVPGQPLDHDAGTDSVDLTAGATALLRAAGPDRRAGRRRLHPRAAGALLLLPRDGRTGPARGVVWLAA
jgi:copper oxidase (laccase) domain-containing protein